MQRTDKLFWKYLVRSKPRTRFALRRAPKASLKPAHRDTFAVLRERFGHYFDDIDPNEWVREMRED